MLSAIEMLLPLIAVVLVVGPLGLMFAGKLNVKNARNRMLAYIFLWLFNCLFVGKPGKMQTCMIESKYVLQFYEQICWNI